MMGIPIQTPLSLTLGECAVLKAIAHHDLTHHEQQALRAFNDAPWLLHHGLHTLVVDRVGAINPALATELKPHIALNVANAALQSVALADLLAEINKRELSPPIVFKGSAFMHSLYDKPWLRPKTDHDVLIPESAREDYHRMLIENGFEAALINHGPLLSYQSSYFKPLTPACTLHVDLHWRISNRQQLRDLIDYPTIFNASERQTIQAANQASVAMHVPDPATALTLASVHLAGHHRGDERLLWLFDIWQLLETLSDAASERLIQQCAMLQVSGLVLEYANLSAYYFGELSNKALTAELSQLAQGKEATQRLLTRPHTRTRLFIWDLKALPSLKTKAQFVHQTVFPPTEYLKHEFKTSSWWLAQWRRLIRRMY